MSKQLFKLFRTRMDNEAECVQKFETRFITEGASATTIFILRLKENRDANIVGMEAEGPDSVIIFTPKQLYNENNLRKTDYYIWNGKMYFVYEDISITRDVNYIKQKAYQCNTTIKVLENNCYAQYIGEYGEKYDYGGYFLSSLRSYQDTELQNNLNIRDKEQPILITPYQKWIKIGAKIEVGNKPWKVIDFDAITNPGIVYISLQRDFFKKGTDINDIKDDTNLYAGATHTVFTQDGYFNSSSPLNIKLRTADVVEFEVPYGIEGVVIYTKDIAGNIQQHYYKVVL